MTNNAIFGYSGLVGKHLIQHFYCNHFYNSKNIDDSVNSIFDIMLISCVPAIKWLANKYPEKDTQIIENLKAIFKTIKASNVILISTIDIYDNINNKSNETSKIDFANNNTYGKNRYLFEMFIKEQFSNVLILRLPALFGNGLKKNIIYDLLYNNNVNNIYINSHFQWYNLDWLNEDIELCLKNKITECNLFTEPLETNKIIELFPEYNYNNNPSVPFKYDTTTMNHRYFPSGNNGYIRNNQIVYQSLKQFIVNKKVVQKFKLCVSNISNNNLNNIQYYTILKHYGIEYIEIAPTKFGEWSDLFNKPILVKEIELMQTHGLQLYSFQSITYKITDNIFQKDNSSLLNHIKNVIEIALKFNVNNLVFGCPKNREISHQDILNDVIFIDFFCKLGNYIGDRNLIISIENNSKQYKCNYLNTINEVGNIVKKINHPKIKMMVDIGNCIMENDNIYDLISYKEHINHIHISMPFMKPLINYNICSYTTFVDILRQINYDKIISLEFLNNDSHSGNELVNLNSSLKHFIDLFI